jgi:hypothetical protein
MVLAICLSLVTGLLNCRSRRAGGILAADFGVLACRKQKGCRGRQETKGMNDTKRGGTFEHQEEAVVLFGVCVTISDANKYAYGYCENKRVFTLASRLQVE